MKRNFYFIIIPLFISLLMILVLLFPKYQNLTLLKKEILAKEFEFQTQEEYFQGLQKTSQVLKEYETSLSKIDSALPKNPSLPGFFDFIQKTSSQSGLVLKAISPPASSITKDTKVKETKISFTLVGEYPQFKNFLSILEKSARFIEVENISFTFPKEGQFNFNLITKIYSY